MYIYSIQAPLILLVFIKWIYLYISKYLINTIEKVYTLKFNKFFLSIKKWL